MKVFRLACVLALLTGGAAASAHAHLEKSVPADGSRLNAAPANFVLTFARPVRLTALTLQAGTAAAQKLGPLPAAAAAEVSIPAPKLANGAYVLSWRSVAADGHVMPGKLSFTVHAAP